MTKFYVDLKTVSWAPASVYERHREEGSCIVCIEAESRSGALDQLRSLLQRLLDEATPHKSAEDRDV